MRSLLAMLHSIMVLVGLAVTRGLAKTQMTSAPVSSVPLLATPMMFSGYWTTDANIGAGTVAFASLGPLVAGKNLTNQIGTSAYQGPSSGDVLLGLITSGATAGAFTSYITDGDYSNQNTGIRFQNVSVFTSRFFPKFTAQGANVDLVYFCGINKDVASAGIHAGIGTLAATVNWFAGAVPACGFYFRPAESANWQLLTCDGAGNSSKIITNIAANLTQTQELTFTFDGTTVTFYIAGKKAGSITQNIPPPNATGMCCWAGMGNVGTVGGGNQVFGIAYQVIGFR